MARNASIRWLALLGWLSLAAVIGCGKDSARPAPAAPSGKPGPTSPTAAPPIAATGYHLPSESELPQDATGAAVRRGLALVTRTYETVPDHVGSGLHCTSCHLDGGTKALASPWLGVVAKYPTYRARSGKQDTIEERINDCFERSLNGRALDPKSEDMAAIVAYMRFISRDVPPGETPGRGFAKLQAPQAIERAHGQALYEQKCSTCHGRDGAGLAPNGVYAFPPLGGPRSFNIGAGMARLNNAAAFIQANMPLGQGGTLTTQEAYDVADYVIHLERPDFADKVHDWPKGDKPKDARY